MNSVKKWYFSINERGFQSCLDQITVAVKSCLMNTSLKPYCIYGGSDLQHIAKLGELGVEVIQHSLSIEGDLKAGYGDKYPVFSGHWLRVDLPEIETTEALVLYTDTDVVFMKDIGVIEKPAFLAAAPEFTLGDYSRFNSGVMLMNVDSLRKVHRDFLSSIRDRLQNDFKFPAHDQESYNRFFIDKYTHMSPLMNWKVYWGVNPDAVILHLHGPKFHIAERLRSGDEKGIPAGHVRLWKKDPNAYMHYQRLYESYL